jgi:hypothetical protein
VSVETVSAEDLLFYSSNRVERHEVALQAYVLLSLRKIEDSKTYGYKP